MPSAATSISPWPSVLALAFVLVVIFGMAWALKRWRLPGIGSAVPMRTVGTLHLGQRERVVIVEIGAQWHVLGVTAQSINAIAQIEPAALKPLASPESDHGTPPDHLMARFTHNFADQLKQKLGKSASAAPGQPP